MRYLRWLGVFLFSLLFFLNIWQGYRYAALKEELRRLELEQQRMVEENKKLITAVEALRHPQRIERLGEESLGLGPVGDRLVIEVEGGGE
ncbi:hypothetical protein [Spirochaeta thermophila]|uniref:Cell division protein FtsL n=2 Tax=Winmispira thermophila TaxID=154 RepID=G0GCA7_WINT7|nr:hypothetical protein [Spirochaeta thermophila]ADN01840.1 hypothetical protein STHERM_c08930 [Spirochaeta thermophila DSM 6192]AEJ61192.1 hypothetical protein Spith_0918 [Spirochaeta thermophila DSM 6578]